MFVNFVEFDDALNVSFVRASLQRKNVGISFSTLIFAERYYSDCVKSYGAFRFRQTILAVHSCAMIAAPRRVTRSLCKAPGTPRLHSCIFHTYSFQLT